MKAIVSTTLLALLALPSLVGAADWTVGEPLQGKGGALVIPVGLDGDGVVSDAMMDLRYDAESFTATVEAANGAVCVVHPKGGIVRVISPDDNSRPIKKGMNHYCNVKLTRTGKANPAAVAQLSVESVWCNKSDASSVECGSDVASLSQ